MKWIFGGLAMVLMAATIFFASNAAMAKDETDPSKGDAKVESIQLTPSTNVDVVDCVRECDYKGLNCTKEELENCMINCKSSCKSGGNFLEEETEEGDC